MLFKKDTFLSLIQFFMVFLFLGACSGQGSEGPEWGNIQARIIIPEKREVVEWDEFTGRFRASKRVEIRARVSGYLNKVEFQDGELVEEGQALFVIDPRPFEIDLESATASYEQAKKVFERAENLQNNNVISEEEYDSRLQGLRVAKAELEDAQLNLEFTTVRAPFAGRVSRNFVDEGNLISGGDANATLLTTIVAVNPVEFYFEASESDVLRYLRLYNSGARSGERGESWPVFVKLQDEEDFVHEGVINFVDNELDQDTGTKEIRAVFTNETGILEPGLFGRLAITTTESFEALLVPDTAIGTEQTRKYVYVLDEESKAVRTYIKLGALDKDGSRIVKEGLKEGDRVVVGNLHMIQPGMVVQPVMSQGEK